MAIPRNRGQAPRHRDFSAEYRDIRPVLTHMSASLT